MRHSIELFGFLSFAKLMGKIEGAIINKSFLTQQQSQQQMYAKMLQKEHSKVQQKQLVV